MVTGRWSFGVAAPVSSLFSLILRFLRSLTLGSCTETWLSRSSLSSTLEPPPCLPDDWDWNAFAASFRFETYCVLLNMSFLPGEKSSMSPDFRRLRRADSASTDSESTMKSWSLLSATSSRMLWRFLLLLTGSITFCSLS